MIGYLRGSYHISIVSATSTAFESSFNEDITHCEARLRWRRCSQSAPLIPTMTTVSQFNNVSLFYYDPKEHRSTRLLQEIVCVKRQNESTSNIMFYLFVFNREQTLNGFCELCSRAQRYDNDMITSVICLQYQKLLPAFCTCTLLGSAYHLNHSRVHPCGSPLRIRLFASMCHHKHWCKNRIIHWTMLWMCWLCKGGSFGLFMPPHDQTVCLHPHRGSSRLIDGNNTAISPVLFSGRCWGGVEIAELHLPSLLWFELMVEAATPSQGFLWTSWQPPRPPKHDGWESWRAWIMWGQWD